MSKQASSPPPGDRPVGTAPPPPPKWWQWLWPIAVLIIVLVWFLPVLVGAQSESLSCSQFLADVDAHQVKTVTIAGNGRASGTLVDGRQFTTVVPMELAGPALLSRLSTAQVEVRFTASSPDGGSQLLSWVFLLLPFLLILWFWRRMSAGAGALPGTLGIGKSRAKLFDAERPHTTFADVAGYEGTKGEIAEVVDFLRQPERYRRAGATAPERGADDPPAGKRQDPVGCPPWPSGPPS